MDPRAMPADANDDSRTTLSARQEVAIVLEDWAIREDGPEEMTAVLDEAAAPTLIGIPLEGEELSDTEPPSTVCPVDTVFPEDAVDALSGPSSSRRLEHLARQNMELQRLLHQQAQQVEDLQAAQASINADRERSKAASPVPEPQPKRKPTQAGYYPATNPNVAAYKRQAVSPNTRWRLDQRIEKKRRYRERKEQESHPPERDQGKDKKKR